MPSPPDRKKPKAGHIPVLVYNHHPFKVSSTVECEFNLEKPYPAETFIKLDVYKDGKKLPCQLEHEDSNMPLRWRTKIVFSAKLDASCMNRFDCKITFPKKAPTLKSNRSAKRLIFKGGDIEVHINKTTGFIDAYKIKGTSFLKKGAFEPLVIRDDEDSWGHQYRYYDDIVGRFKLMSAAQSAAFSGTRNKQLTPVRVIEDGPCRTIVEAVFEYNDSMICQRYLLPQKGTEIGIETRVYWNEKTKLLKLAIPTKGQDCAYLGQTAYGTANLPDDGHEAVAQKWLAVTSKKDNLALTCINEGTYASDYKPEHGLRLTLLRSPGYAVHVAQNLKGLHFPQDRFTPRIDQGMRIFRFWLNAGKIKNTLNSIDRRALARNEKPFALSFFPSGSGTKPKPLAVLSDKVIQITTIKRAQKNSTLIIRLSNPTPDKHSTVLSLPFIGKKIKLPFTPFEIKTLSINPRSGKHKEVNLLER